MKIVSKPNLLCSHCQTLQKFPPKNHFPRKTPQVLVQVETMNGPAPVLCCKLSNPQPELHLALQTFQESNLLMNSANSCPCFPKKNQGLSPMLGPNVQISPLHQSQRHRSQDRPAASHLHCCVNLHRQQADHQTRSP